MAIVAFTTWLLTAVCGLGLVSIWIIEHDRAGPASRLPKTLVGAHAVLAVAGLVVWSSFLFVAARKLAWATVAILVVVALLGLTMMTRWIGVYRSFRARSRVLVPAGIHGVPIEPPAPPERHLPIVLVILHGVLAVLTLLLVLLTAIDLGTS
jgi:hypothetical protein